MCNSTSCPVKTPTYVWFLSIFLQQTWRLRSIRGFGFQLQADTHLQALHPVQTACWVSPTPSPTQHQWGRAALCEDLSTALEGWSWEWHEWYVNAHHFFSKIYHIRADFWCEVCVSVCFSSLALWLLITSTVQCSTMFTRELLTYLFLTWCYSGTWHITNVDCIASYWFRMSVFVCVCVQRFIINGRIFLFFLFFFCQNKIEIH